MNKERLLYADFLRIIATFAVMFLHIAANQWYSTDINSFEWQVFNIYDSLVRFCVPVFVMLSGMFFLEPGKQIPIKKIYTKYILRIVTAFILWSAAYVIFNNFIMNKNIINDKTVNSMLAQFLEGNYHLWFLFMIWIVS
jgi:surface polysaccharide O-acyltransferase-like enzyme